MNMLSDRAEHGQIRTIVYMICST